MEGRNIFATGGAIVAFAITVFVSIHHSPVRNVAYISLPSLTTVTATVRFSDPLLSKSSYFLRGRDTTRLVDYRTFQTVGVEFNVEACSPYDEERNKT